MKASSLRWGLILSWGGFALAMFGLTIYRTLRASAGDTAKAALLLSIFLGALGVAVLLVVIVYRRAAATARGLLAALEGKHPGRAFAVFKTIRLQDDIDTLPLSLKGDVWDKRTLYAVLTLDSESMTFWDGSATKPVMTARLDTSELQSIDPADDAALIFNAKALTLSVVHNAVTLRVTVAPAQTDHWIFLPTPDSFALLETALTTSRADQPTTQNNS